MERLRGSCPWHGERGLLSLEAFLQPSGGSSCRVIAKTHSKMAMREYRRDEDNATASGKD